MSDYGEIQFKDKMLKIMQLPYINGDFYEALSIDADSYEYLVKWDVINENCLDESDACNWEVFKITELDKYKEGYSI